MLKYFFTVFLFSRFSGTCISDISKNKNTAKINEFTVIKMRTFLLSTFPVKPIKTAQISFVKTVYEVCTTDCNIIMPYMKVNRFPWYAPISQYPEYTTESS